MAAFHGESKMADTLPKGYEPHDVEARWRDHWQDNRTFTPDPDAQGEPFSIVIPPPNVTGALHIGHALNQTLIDVLCRHARQKGKNVLWVPGTDHAGIATQNVVERALAKEGKTRQDLGREAFIERVWQWREDYGHRILNQIRALGASVDWTRLRFTMDEGLSAAVRKVFVQLYNEGLIYKGDYIINWCSRCHTALADDEVEHEAHKGKLWKIRYHLADGSGSITIATTRPETIPGDTAICVHPEDERYQHLVGKTAIVPVLGREIPIIADSYVDREFGTGALKVTPCHDHNDWALGKKHDLEFLQVIDEDGIMKAESGPYAGLKKEDCRTKIVADIEAAGDLLAVEDLDNSVGHCYRCHTVVEPHVSTQWFVATTKMAPAARKAVPELTRILPESWAKTYYHWLDNIRDWCISRQIWWGHRIPAWTCAQCGELIVAEHDPSSCPKCGCTDLKQDEDVLDTWFSSALWPFSTLGWPKDTPEYEYFYPTDVLVTGYDIIFFWVIRMVFSGLEQTGKEPFHTVLIHGLVRDSQGRKMSKSLGNGIDPLEVIDKYGADALRMTLMTGNAPGNDMRFYWERVEASRNFANKVWNASRFIMMNIEKAPVTDVKLSDLQMADRWILSKVNTLAKDVTENMDKYELGIALQKVYDFIWEEFCDWYIEMVKPRLWSEEDTTKAAALWTLKTVLIQSLKLLHPYMPFITEEIFCNLQDEEPSIMISSWPEYKDEWNFADEEKAVETIKDAVRAIRGVRTSMNVPPSKKAKVYVVSEDPEVLAIFEHSRVFFATLGYASEVVLQKDKSGIADDAVSAVTAKATIYMPFAELVDLDKEIERLETDGHLGSTKKMKDFTSGRECECYVSVHEATNRLTTLPVDALTLPTRIYGKEIGDDIKALRSGKEILVEDIHLKDGRVISGHARVDANRGDVVFRNDNNPHLRIHDTVFGVKVSADIQAKLANHEVVFIPGMKVGGKTISTDLRYSDTGRPLFGNNARNYRSRLGEENPRPRQRVRRRLPSLPGAQPKGMKIG